MTIDEAKRLKARVLAARDELNAAAAEAVDHGLDVKLETGRVRPVRKAYPKLFAEIRCDLDKIEGGKDRHD